MSDARENYKAVFGVYPNSPEVLNAEGDFLQARQLALNLENAVQALEVLWQKTHFAGVSESSRDLLQQIQVATAALRAELVKST
jgi:hypothetical protein